MKSIAFFNNTDGANKTSLVYHLAWMVADQEQRVVAVDLDPQAKLSSMFLNQETLETIWQGAERKSIDGAIKPLLDGIGDIAAAPHIEKIGERIGLLPGDLALSNREDELSVQWRKCLDGQPRAYRVTTAFAHLINRACEKFQADIALIDVGPNLSAINRSALIACDYIVIPLSPDLFSLQGLRNAGPALEAWRADWKERRKRAPQNLGIDLPAGEMRPLGYIVKQHTVYLSRPVYAYGRWMNAIPMEYSKSVLREAKPKQTPIDADEHCLANWKNYHTLGDIAQEAGKPMFMLKPADGAFGGLQKAVLSCYQDFNALRKKILSRLS